MDDKENTEQVNLSMQQQRMQICRKCEFFDQEYTSCGLCGCYLPIKTYFKFFECPTGQWPEI